MVEFVKNKQEFSYCYENKNASLNEGNTAYKTLNKMNKTKKFCSHYKRKNHVRSECYYLKNQNQNNYSKIELNGKKILQNFEQL